MDAGHQGWSTELYKGTFWGDENILYLFLKKISLNVYLLISLAVPGLGYFGMRDL